MHGVEGTRSAHPICADERSLNLPQSDRESDREGVPRNLPRTDRILVCCLSSLTVAKSITEQVGQKFPDSPWFYERITILIGFELDWYVPDFQADFVRPNHDLGINEPVVRVQTELLILVAL